MTDSTSTATRSTQQGFKRRNCVLVVSGMMLLTLLWGGCNVQKNYDLLSFFFDGVPDPNATDAPTGLAIRQSPTYSEHKPFAEESCLKCHPNPSEMQLTKNDSSICLQCHDDIVNQYPMMHGAVTGMACLWCHNPHLSPLPHLLRDNAPKLCLQCHELGVMQSPIPQHEDLQQDCLKCHNAHGGSDPAFLRDQTLEEQTGSSPPAAGEQL